MPLVHHRISIVMCCRTSRSITDSQYIHQPLPEILYTPHVFEINIDKVCGSNIVKSYMQCIVMYENCVYTLSFS